MSLQLVADNRNIAQPYRSQRELRARRAQLGLVSHYGGRSLPVPMSVYDAIRAPFNHQPAGNEVQARDS